MTLRRSTLAGITVLTVLAATGIGLWHGHGSNDAEAANRLSAQRLLRQACPFSLQPEQVRRIGATAATAAGSHARTLIWAGPQLLYTSDPAFTPPAPLLSGPQRTEPGWTGWAEVDLPCGLSVQRFQKIPP